MHPLHGEGDGRALLHDGFAADDLHGEAVQATVDVHQLQARYVAGLAIRLVIQQQLQ
ncbi:hypothetical protein D3C81_2015470 [compost metagenome]